MKRLNIELTEESLKIYKAVPLFERSKFVSDAIIEKHTRDTGTSLEQRFDDIERRLQKLEKGGTGK